MLLMLPAVKSLTAMRIQTKLPVKLLKKLFEIAVLPSLVTTLAMSTKSVSAGSLTSVPCIFTVPTNDVTRVCIVCTPSLNP